MAAIVKSDLEVRLGAQMFLAETGWRCRIDAGSHRGEPVEVFVAIHDSYPEQRAIEVRELVRRCVWQENHRTPLSTREPTR